MIQYKETTSFAPSQLKELFTSVGWRLGNPEKLIAALENSDTVLSVWDGERLIGLVNALSDRVNTVYFHFVLIHGAYHEKGIGKIMMKKIMEKYHQCRHMILASVNDQIGFFTKCGFQIGQGATLMEIRQRS